MLEDLKQRVLEANIALAEYGLVTLTWGNVSGIDREKGLIVIKPSGVGYEDLTLEKMSVLDLDNRLVEGLQPSSDTPTHIELYRAFPAIGGITHTHSRYATIFAQEKRAIPPYGTTHADYFYGEIPCTRPLSDLETGSNYEHNTGRVIAECHSDPVGIPAVLVACHAPFTWGESPEEAVQNAVVLEEIAFMARHMKIKEPVPQALLDKHYSRKHGENAYYGQGF